MGNMRPSYTSMSPVLHNFDCRDKNYTKLIPTLLGLKTRFSVKRLGSKGGVMEQVNLSSVIEQAITRFNRNRIGEKPPVFVTLSPVLPQVPWKGSALKQFLQCFLYESLLTSDASAAIEISLRRRTLLKDLTAFVGIQPTYWVQVRISGRGLRVAEQVIED